MKHPTLAPLKRLNAQFEQLQTVEELASLLHTDKHKLQLMATTPSYNTFIIKKPSGGERYIEDPAASKKSNDSSTAICRPSATCAVRLPRLGL